jgi:hypothetical protein
MLEDSTGLRTAAILYHQPQAFTPLKDGWQGDPTSYYWLRTTFHATTPANRGNVLSFSHRRP